VVKLFYFGNLSYLSNLSNLSKKLSKFIEFIENYFSINHRALEIVQNEDYLDEADLDVIKKRKIKKRFKRQDEGDDGDPRVIVPQTTATTTTTVTTTVQTTDFNLVETAIDTAQ
jgi:uncharacterized protein YdcH (DUF465 family)